MADLIRPNRRGIWWKLALLFLFFVMLALVLSHAIWRGNERAKVVTRIAAVRAAGEPIDVADLVEPDVPDDANVVVLIRAATALIVKNPDFERRRNDLETDDLHAFELPLTPAERSILSESTAANAPAIAKLLDLPGRSSIAWHDAWAAGPMLLREDRDYTTVRTLANLLSDLAVQQIDDGRTGEAFTNLSALPPISRAMAAKRTLIGSLIACGVEAMRVQRILDFTPSVRAADATTRAELNRVTTDLCDDAAVRGWMRDGLLGERVSLHEAMSGFTSGLFGTSPAVSGSWGGVKGYLISPMLNASDAAMLDYISEAITIVDAKSEADRLARSGTMRAIEANARGSYTLLMAGVLLPSLDRAIGVQFRTLTDRHLAAAALAIRLYQIDHAGQRPAALAELVPAYLAAVPTDAIDGQPLRYDRDRAILWSVGEDGIDEGGDATPRKPNSDYRWTLRDAVVFLNRQPRPATRPA